ncbi:MAG: Uncharacterized protein FD123_2324 [Bacteroidetes bacterium]|nr:MAG: Uncharacterized protein FD123_2324 [Bacteroidota bacterium]
MKNENMNTESKTQGKGFAIVLIAAVFFLIYGNLQAQAPQVKTTAAVLNIDTKNMGLEPEQMGNLVRLELEKLDTFNVLDRYDVTYLVEKNKLQLNNCYGKICLVEVGKALNVEKVISGSVERFGDMVVFTLRLVDVKMEIVEKTEVTEFLNLPNETQTMANLALRKLFNRPVNAEVEHQFIKPANYVDNTRAPQVDRLRLDGPRWGATMFTGKTASILGDKKAQGGFDAYPVMFQFGYQFERQYLTTGNFQALVEAVPMITGLEQGLFVPSFTLLNGLRSNKGGWEFAFGPTFSVVATAEGFYENDEWHTKGEWNDSLFASPPVFERRLDSRGSATLHPSFVFAIGKTMRFGNLNMPINAYFVPGKDGARFGLSLGYNVRNRKRS